MKNIVFLSFLGLFYSAFVIAQGGMGAGKGPPPAPVRVAKVSRLDMSPTTLVAGTVVSRSDARVAAEVSGRLIWVVEVGDRINEGDVAARLEDTQRKLQVSELEAQLASEKARLVFLNQEVERLRRLAKENNAAKNRLDQAEADRHVALSEQSAALARLNLARDRVERSELKAPFSGIVTERLKQKGEWVDNGDAVLRLMDSSSLEVQARVPISSLAYLSTGQTIRVLTGETMITGRIRTIVPVGDERSRLLDLRVDLGDASMPVGQSVRVAVPTAMPRQVLALPRDALVLRRNGVRVFIIDAQSNAVSVEVNTGIADGSFIEVSGKLTAGDNVVIRGGERLRQGQSVQILAGN